MERFKWLWQVYQDGGLPADLESALEVHGNHREVFHCNKAYLVISVLGKYDHFRVKLFEAWRATQKLATQRSKSQVSKSQVHLELPCRWAHLRVRAPSLLAEIGRFAQIGIPEAWMRSDPLRAMPAD